MSDMKIIAPVAQRGVTLMELLTVVVIVAVLASVAVPAYRNYLLRAQRTDAKTALLRVQAAQEKFYLQNNSYTSNLKDAPPAGLGVGETSDNGYYAITVDPEGESQDYTVTATPIAGAGQDKDTQCTSFSINAAGVRSAEGSADPATCWR